MAMNNFQECGTMARDRFRWPIFVAGLIEGELKAIFFNKNGGTFGCATRHAIARYNE